MSPDHPPQLHARGLAHLVAVYLAWGSTYLAIRVAVEPGAGFPPFQMGGTRTLVAGVCFLAWGLLAGGAVRVRGRDAAVLAASGLLLWMGGNGLVVWAEQRASSGYAALLVGSTPLWLAILEAVVDRRRPTGRLVAALATGFLGLGVLSWPVVSAGSTADLWATLALLVAPLSWGAGSLLQKRLPVSVSATVAAGWQHLAGAAGFLFLSLVTAEPLARPTPLAWGATAYLVVGGSFVGFLSFVKALHLLPLTVVGTYAYVNPVIAVALGWLVLQEPVTGWTAGGAALAVLGVVGVFRAQRDPR